MSAPASPTVEPRPARTKGARAELTAVVAVVGIMALVLAGLVGYGLGGKNRSPADDSPEAGFARDMQTHHAQAVRMAWIVRDKTTDPTLRTIAYDIATGQQQQIGQMYGWLVVWDLPQTSAAPAMTWMQSPGSGGHDMSSMGSTATAQAGNGSAGMPGMPGMATPAQIAQLEQATGVQAERLFLQLMIAHHKGGVEMAKAVLARTTRPEVVDLARAIETAQQAEIEQLTALLAERR